MKEVDRSPQSCYGAQDVLGEVCEMSGKRRATSVGRKPRTLRRTAALTKAGRKVAAVGSATRKRGAKRRSDWDAAPIWSLGDHAVDLGIPDASERYEDYLYGVSGEDDER